MKKIIIITETNHKALELALKTAREGVFTATEPQEMEQALLTLAKAKEALKIAKNKFKEFEAEPKAQLKNIETSIKQLEQEVKDKALETYKEEKIQKVNQETGEVKTITKNNLGKKRFTYRAETTTQVIDKEALLANHDKYIHELFKWKLEIDEKALTEYIEKNGLTDLPTKVIVKGASIGLQQTETLTSAKEQNFKILPEEVK